MRTYALSAVGADRPGIIAAIAERLAAGGVNVTDSQMGILRGSFAMTLIIQVPDDSVIEELRGADLGVALSVDPVTKESASDAPTHVVSVYGADHPGILASVTASLASADANVCHLRTRLVESDSVYVMVIDISVPDGVDVGAALDAVAEAEDVSISLRPADDDVL